MLCRLFFAVCAVSLARAWALDGGVIEVRGLPGTPATLRLERADGLVVTAPCGLQSCAVPVPAGLWSAAAYDAAGLIGSCPQDLDVVPGKKVACGIVD